MRRLVVIAVLVGGGACGARGAAQLPADTDGVRLADREAASRYSKETERIEVPFELDRAGLNGTALVINFMRDAQASGARYVSDLAIAIHFTHDGVSIECVSTLAVGEPASRGTVEAARVVPAADDIYATKVQPWEPEQVRAWVDDRDLVCRKVGVATAVRRYPSRHDASIGQYYAPGQLPQDTDAWVEYKDDCRLVTRHRQVERYAHFVAARFAPIDLPRIQAEYADEPVRELPPECRQIPAGEHPEHRVMGNLHYLGAYGRTTQQPDVLTH